MYVTIYHNPQEVTEEEWRKDALLLPAWRRQRAVRYRFLIDRVLCTKAYLLLREGLSLHYGIEGNPTFGYVDHNKPVLKEYPHIHFNLSHCRRGVLCVIDDQPVGCDIEEMKEKLDIEMMKRCFNEQEIEEIVHANHPCIAFTQSWTMKESVLKLTGEGLRDDLHSLLQEETMSRLNITTVVVEEEGYVYSVARYKAAFE